MSNTLQNKSAVIAAAGFAIFIASCKPTAVSNLQSGDGVVTLTYSAGSVTARMDKSSLEQVEDLASFSYAVQGQALPSVSTSFVPIAQINIQSAKFATASKSCNAFGQNGVLTYTCEDMMIPDIPMGQQQQQQPQQQQQQQQQQHQQPRPPQQQQSQTVVANPTASDFAVTAQYGGQQTVSGVLYQEFWLSLTATSAAGQAQLNSIESVEFRTHSTFAKVGQEVISVTRAEGLRTPRLGTYATSWTTGGTTVKFNNGRAVSLPGTAISWTRPVSAP